MPFLQIDVKKPGHEVLRLLAPAHPVPAGVLVDDPHQLRVQG